MKIHEEPKFADRIALEETFFAKDFLMSYSGLNKLLYSPDSFYRHYVLRQRDDTQTQNMIEGSLLHCLLLEPEKFDDQFILNHETTPSDAQKALIHNLFGYYKADIADGDTPRTELAEYEEEILEYLININLYQSLKADLGRLAKIINEKNEAYWEYLKLAEGRVVISHDTYNHIVEAVEKVKSNPTVMDIMGFFADSMNGITTQNELDLVQLKTKFHFGLRGIIDNLVFDPGKKEIRLNDLKSSGKSIGQFEDAIEYYKYWIQAAIYYTLVKEIYLSKPEHSGWTMTYRFIVVDKFCQTASIRIKEETMTQWIVDTEEILQQADYHFEVQDFKLPYNFLINKNELVI